MEGGCIPKSKGQGRQWRSTNTVVVWPVRTFANSSRGGNRNPAQS